MRLRPEYSMYDVIKKSMLDEEFEVATSKIRWSQMKDGDPGKGNEEVNVEELDKDTMDREDAKA